jgi:hypothetical protein
MRRDKGRGRREDLFRIGAGLAGDAALVVVLDRVADVTVLRASAAGLAGGLGPLAIGIAAERFGLPWALAALAVVPVVILADGRPRRE